MPVTVASKQGAERWRPFQPHCRAACPPTLAHLPPGPRPLSKTVTSCVARSRRAHAAAATPEPWMATRMDRASATTTMVARSRRRREQQREVRHAERQKGSVEKSLTARCGFRLQIGSKGLLAVRPYAIGRWVRFCPPQRAIQVFFRLFRFAAARARPWDWVDRYGVLVRVRVHRPPSG